VTIYTFYKVVICLFGALILFQLCSCKIFDPDTAVPVYIKVPTVVFKDNSGLPASEGDTTSNITDLWTYANNNSTGVYDVPSEYPVLVSGNTYVQLTPGVEENGISNTRAVYPFYTYDTVTVNVQPGNTYSITPHYTYRSGVMPLKLNCNFEGSTDFKNYGVTDTSMLTLTKSQSSQVKYGSSCGYICLDAGHPVYQGITIGAYPLSNTSGVWLEMDYMCNISFSVGLVGIISPNDTVGSPPYPDYFEGLNPIGTWTKIYLNLTSTVQDLNANTYMLAFYAQLPTGTSVGQIYLDNIKLVYIPQ
jgi:hypothetical protein